MLQGRQKKEGETIETEATTKTITVDDDDDDNSKDDDDSTLPHYK